MVVSLSQVISSGTPAFSPRRSWVQTPGVVSNAIRQRAPSRRPQDLRFTRWPTRSKN